MADLHSVFKCNVCGLMVEGVHAGGGIDLIHCGQPMVQQRENTVDASKEKHVPVAERAASLKVKVGAVPHPMEEKHHIEWIEVLADGRSYRKFLKPGDKPEAEFALAADAAVVRAYCNLHGLWKS